MAGRGQRIGRADQPPKQSNKNKTKRAPKALSSRAYLKTPYSQRSSTSSSTAHPELHWPTTESATHTVEVGDPENFSGAVETLRFDGLFAVDDDNIDARSNSSIELLAHQTEEGYLDSTVCYSTIDAIDFDGIYPLPACPHDAAILSLNFGDGRENETWSRSYPNDQYSLVERYEVNAYQVTSRYPDEESLPQGETSHSSAPSPPEQVPSYQLGKWVYNTRNEEMTFTEKTQKSNWEGSCFSRL